MFNDLLMEMHVDDAMAELQDALDEAGGNINAVLPPVQGISSVTRPQTQDPNRPQAQAFRSPMFGMPWRE